jgi:hypothetical protein
VPGVNVGAVQLQSRLIDGEHGKWLDVIARAARSVQRDALWAASGPHFAVRAPIVRTLDLLGAL